MTTSPLLPATLLGLLALTGALATGEDPPSRSNIEPVRELHSVAEPTPNAQSDLGPVARRIAAGKRTFRFDTFGNEAFWGETLRLHEPIAAIVSPRVALGVGLKIDAAALPPGLRERLRSGRIDLDDPAVTLDLLRRNAVVGLLGTFDESRELTSVGISCALCHSTVDDSLVGGVGERLDGWPNRDLNVGAIMGLSPDLTSIAGLLGLPEETVRDVLTTWGPGRFDAHLLLDGKAFRPDGSTGAVVLPAAFGLSGVNLVTYTGWGSVGHWNSLVANLEMGGQGTFFDPRLDDAAKFPVAAVAGSSNVRATPDLITPKLADLHFYQLSLTAPTPPAGSFDPVAAQRGQDLFSAKAGCAECHVPPLFTEPGWNMHRADEIGIDDFQALRSPDEHYRTTPLGGLFTRSRGGYYHDGRFADLPAVVEHYDRVRDLRLSAAEKVDLAEYLKSL